MVVGPSTTQDLILQMETCHTDPSQPSSGQTMRRKWQTIEEPMLGQQKMKMSSWQVTEMVVVVEHKCSRQTLRYSRYSRRSPNHSSRAHPASCWIMGRASLISSFRLWISQRAWSTVITSQIIDLKPRTRCLHLWGTSWSLKTKRKPYWDQVGWALRCKQLAPQATFLMSHPWKFPQSMSKN